MKELLSAEDRLSPLQHKLTVLGKHIATFGYIGAVFISIVFLFNAIVLQGGGFDAYWTQPSGAIIKDVVTAAILAIIVIVVAVPEGLPMLIAMVLAINMKKLLGVKVLVRKLLGIETAGSLNILFTDKMYAINQGLPRSLAEEITALILTTVAASIVLHGISVIPLMNLYTRRKARPSSR